MKIFSPLHPVRNERLTQFIKHLPGLVAYYPLNEVAGTIAKNKAPSTFGTLDGTISGATIGQPGKVGRAYSFDGINDRVAITNNAVLNTSRITVGAIFSGTVASTDDQIYTKDNTNTSRLFQFRRQGNVLSFIPFNAGSNSSITGSTVLAVDTLYFGVATWDGTTINLYLNGVADATPVSFSGTLRANQAGNFFIGSSDLVDPGWWPGKIQHVFHCSEAISSAKALKLARIAGFA